MISTFISGLIGLISLIIFFVMAKALANISENIRNMNRILSIWEQGQRQERPVEHTVQPINKNDPNTMTYRNKSTKAVQTVSREYWENLIKNYGGDNFEIID
jgi:hypothetical protein